MRKLRLLFVLGIILLSATLTAGAQPRAKQQKKGAKSPARVEVSERENTLLELTRQANFLVGLGLGTNISAEDESDSLERVLAKRRGIQALVSPEGLGMFHVLLLGKDIDTLRARALLSGLRYAGI